MVQVLSLIDKEWGPMSDQLYRGLARRLDSIPPGFPASESGVELALLSRLYSPDEATIVTAMRLNYEPTGAIARRAGMEPSVAQELLHAAARKGLVRSRTEGGEPTYALNPQTAGFAGFHNLEAVSHDAEAAELYARWIQETRGGSLSDTPAARRVIPVEESISISLAIHPYELASEIVANARSWGVLDCMCRTRTRTAGEGCSHLLSNCLLFGPDEGAFDNDDSIRAISQEEALRILREAEDGGLVHTTGNFGDHDSVICNCCPCCCSMLRGVVKFHRPSVVAHSDFCATVDETACAGCGDCLERCHFGALSLPDSVCAVDHDRCVGCGLCTLACSFDALSLWRRPAGETPPRSADLDAWMAEHAKGRGLSLAE
jgi:electron transport complex protein RnfB